MPQKLDKVIFGGGLYGLYAALKCGEKGQSVAVIERDALVFSRATYINQARVHQGYHYPRSYSTAVKSAHYFERFCHDYDFCIHKSFEQIYATSSAFSWTNADEFRKFCEKANIRCEDVAVGKYFNKGMCDGAFATEEYTYDAGILGRYYTDKLAKLKNVELICSDEPQSVKEIDGVWNITTKAGRKLETEFILNATYAGVNNIHALMNFEPFKIKYELCEIILCTVNERLVNTGITVMDGPFFSLMPFGKTGLHSLTSVSSTPHITSYQDQPTFACQSKSGALCKAVSLHNCNNCPARPASAWPYMSQLAHKYLKEEYGFEYKQSLFSMKPILKSSEIDDSRPTVMREMQARPQFISVLSGKINTVYDLDEVL